MNPAVRLIYRNLNRGGGAKLVFLSQGAALARTRKVADVAAKAAGAVC
jgi:hypothetical protein